MLGGGAPARNAAAAH